MYKRFFKRVIDILISFTAIIILIPLWIILSLLIFVTDPGKVFFTQERIGKNKKRFKILKLRTMNASAPNDVPTHLFENSERYFTPIGRFLRDSGLDELPQLFNVLAGQMSLVGPRPALWNQDDLVEMRDKYNANSVRPGLTGWAQINGRDDIPMEKKVELDGEYMEKLSFGFDLKCFFGTVGYFFKRK